MGNMKFDGADVTFELDGYDALTARVRAKNINCKINPSDLPRLYAFMDSELEGNGEFAAAFADAQEKAFGVAVLSVWSERIKSFKDSFIPVFGDACKDAACRFGFSKDGNNTFKSAVEAFAANICDLYGAAPQIVDGFCEFLARNACLEFDGYAADMPVPCQLYVAEGISKMAYQQAMNSVQGFKLDADASVEFAGKFISDNIATPDSFIHLNDACVAIENVMAATSLPAAVEVSVPTVAPAPAEPAAAEPEPEFSPAPTAESDADFENAVAAARAMEPRAGYQHVPGEREDAGATGILADVATSIPDPASPASGPASADGYRNGSYQNSYQEAYQGGYQVEGADYASSASPYTPPAPSYGADPYGQRENHGQNDPYGQQPGHDGQSGREYSYRQGY